MGKQQEPKQVQRAGVWLECPVCRGDFFFQREGVLSTRLQSIFDMEWTSPKCDCYVCTVCKHIVWFLGEKEKA